MADTPIREQSALELLETHAKALEAENARLTRELEIQKQGQNAITNGLCAERDRLSAALRGMLKMFGHPREEEYIDNGPSYRMAMDAVDLAMAVLAGSPVETAGKHTVCEGCGNEIDPDVCGCGSPITHSSWEGHSPVPMGCDCMRVAGPEASGEATGPEGDDSNMGTAPTSGPEATSSQGNASPTHFDIFGAVYRHALEIVHLTETVPAACFPVETAGEPSEVWACVSKGISPPYVRFFESKAEMEAYEWRDDSVSPNRYRPAEKTTPEQS